MTSVIAEERRMPLRFYPALLEATPDGSSYGVLFLDLPGCVSGGATAEKAALSAAEALAFHIQGLLEQGQTLPEPSDPNAPLPEWLTEDGPGGPYTVAMIPVEVPARAA
jgi:predicted RNase H-like HicB family nuclease